MDKEYIKSQIVMRQSEFPTDLKPREVPLPVSIGRIVTIPGVRRCGKSSRMESVVNTLLESGVDSRRILWVSFDDERLFNMKADEMQTIIESYRELFPEISMSEVYVFFDEIQLVDGWEYFVMRLFKHYTKNIYISGSNATMLSKELKSALRGWPLEEETYPLSFREYCAFKGLDINSRLEADEALLRNAFKVYNTEGGFPEVVLTDNPILKTRILQNYFDTMLLKDLVEHYNVSNIEVLRYLLKRIMSNLSKPTSIRNIYGDIKSRGLKVNKDAMYDWATYACDIFMFIRIANYSRSLQKMESSSPKYYCIDNGLRDAVLLPQSGDDGKKLENTVFMQLYRQRSPLDKIMYYKGTGECDFVVQSGIDIVQLIQVTWEMNDEETRRREIDGLIEAANVTGCKNLSIITADTSEEISHESGLKINVVPAWRWLSGR